MESASQVCFEGAAIRRMSPTLEGGEARQDAHHSARQEHWPPPASADLAQPLPEEAHAGTAPAAAPAEEALDEGKPAKHHLLRHSLPDELRGTEALKHFDVDNARAAIRKINKMPQKELQAAFERVYGVKSSSNNNSWLRKKLVEAVSMRGRKLTVAELAAIGPRRRRHKRRPAPPAGDALAQPRGDSKAAQALLALLGGVGSGPDQSMSYSGDEEEGGSPHDANSGARAVSGNSPLAPAQGSGIVGEFVQAQAQAPAAAAGGVSESQAGAQQARAPKPAKRAAPLEPRPRSKRTAAAAAVAAVAAAVKQAGQYEDLGASSSSGDEYYHAGPAGPGFAARGMPPHKRTQRGGRPQRGSNGAEGSGWGLLEVAAGGHMGASGSGGRGTGPWEGQGVGGPYGNDAMDGVYRTNGRGYPAAGPQLGLDSYGSGPLAPSGHPSAAQGGYYGTGQCEQDALGHFGYGTEQQHLGRDAMLLGISSGWGGPSLDAGNLWGGQRVSHYGGAPGGYAQQGTSLFGSLAGQGASFAQHAVPAAGDMSLGQAFGVLQRYLSGVQGSDNSGGGSGAQRYESLRMQSQQAQQQRAQQAQQQRPGSLQEVVKSLQMLIPELDPSHPDYPLRAGAAAARRPASGGTSNNASWVQERLASLQRQQAAADVANAAAAAAAPSPFSAAGDWPGDSGGAGPRGGGSAGLNSSLGGKGRAQDGLGSGSGALSGISTGTAAEWNAGAPLHEGSNRGSQLQQLRGSQAGDAKGLSFFPGEVPATAAAALAPQEVPSSAAPTAPSSAGSSAATLAAVARLLQQGRLGSALAGGGGGDAGSGAGSTLSMLQALVAMQQAAK